LEHNPIEEVAPKVQKTSPRVIIAIEDEEITKTTPWEDIVDATKHARQFF
jgi:hypothetical protein